MNELQTTNPSKKLENYIFVRDIISIEGDIDMWGGNLAPIKLTIPNYDSSMVLCLLKDNLVKDDTWRDLNNQEQVKKYISTKLLPLLPYKSKYFFRYKLPDTGKIITIECGEYFLIDYYDIKNFNKDIEELKKVVVELKENKNEQ